MPRGVVARALIVLAGGALAACGIDAIGSLAASAPDAGTDAIAPVDGSAEDGAIGGDGDAPVDAPFDAGPPFLVTDQLSSPHGVAIYGGIAYIAENARGHIRQVPLTGGTNTLYFDTRQAPRVIAVGPTGVYWGEQTKGRLKPFDASVVDLALDGGSQAILLDGDRVVLGNAGAGDRVLTTDLDLTNENDLATAQDDPVGLASDGTFVYWTNATANTIARRRRDASAITEVVVTGETNPDSIVVDGTKIYWTVPGAIRVATIGMWTASDLVSGEGRPRALAKDGGRLYWLDSTKGTVRRADLAGGAPVTLADEPQEDYGFMSGIAFDATYVYWIGSVNGTLKRLPK